MTLKDDNDFRLDEFIAGPPEYFEPFYGLNGVNGDGDVTKSDNLKEFQKFVVDQTNHRGVHLMMADGVARIFFFEYFKLVSLFKLFLLK